MALLRRIPFTGLLLAVVVTTAILTGTDRGPLDPALRRLFGFAAIHLPAFEWHRMLTSVVLTTGGREFYASAAMLALSVGAAELLHGTRRTIAVFLGVHLLTLVLVAVLLALPLASAGVVQGELLAHARDVGPSAGYFGCLGLALTALPRRARAVALIVLLAYLAAHFLWSFVRVPDAGRRISADAAHLIALPLGFLIGRSPFLRRGGDGAGAAPGQSP